MEKEEGKKGISMSVIASVLGLVLVLGVLIIVNYFGYKDMWVQDKRGVWIKNGNPPTIPPEVTRQQEAIKLALELYQKEKAQRVLASQCLGKANNYAVDLVHNPRSQEDNLQENQCPDYLQGKVSKFIEIDAEGNIVRIQE